MVLRLDLVNFSSRTLEIEHNQLKDHQKIHNQTIFFLFVQFLAWINGVVLTMFFIFLLNDVPFEHVSGFWGAEGYNDTIVCKILHFLSK